MISCIKPIFEILYQLRQNKFLHFQNKKVTIIISRHLYYKLFYLVEFLA